MIIVGLMGGIGHGKTTFAEYLANHAQKHRHWETWEVVCEVASVLRHEQPEHPAPDNIAAINAWLTDLADIIATITHTPADFTQLSLTAERIKKQPENYNKLFEYLDNMQAHPELQKIDISVENKAVFRAFLQWLGGYLVKTVNEGIWYDEIRRRIHQSAQEGLELATVGGVRFPGDAERLRNAGGGFIIEIKRPKLDEIDVLDLTERERALIKADSTVINDGTLAQLERCSAQVFRDLSERSLKATYTASVF